MPSELWGDVRHRILSLIQDTNLRCGDRLPSVSELARRFSVAPATVREALRCLQTSGVLDIRHGSGTYVRQTQERFLVANPHHSGLDGQSLLDVLDARARIEPDLAELAARYRTAADLTELDRLLTTAKKHLPRRDETHFRAGMEFHRVIARCGRHRVLGQLVDTLLELHAQEQRAIHGLYADMERDLIDHLAILRAIEDQAARRAYNRMASHLKDVTEVVRTQLEKLPGA